MPLKSLILPIFAALSLATFAIAQDTPAVVVDPAIATMTHEQLVPLREEAMRQNGQLLRGAAGLTGEQAIAAATTLLQNFTNLPAMFPEGSIVAGSKALPAIWTNWDDFKGRFDANAATSVRMLAAAQSGDTATWMAGIQELGESCGGCHMTYRGR